jgi:hypothetical protein
LNIEEIKSSCIKVTEWDIAKTLIKRADIITTIAKIKIIDELSQAEL